MKHFTCEMYQQGVVELERRSPHGRLPHAVLGAASEVGELAALIRLTKKPSREDVLEEVGDVLYYITLGLSAVGYTLEEAFATNLAKLRRRSIYGKDKPMERELYTDTTKALREILDEDMELDQ